MTVPVQEFQIGQRVRVLITGRKPFVIQSIYCATHGPLRYCPDIGYTGFLAAELTLAPERPPYEPSERRTLTRRETDDEMDARHAVERAEYDRLGTDAEVAP